MSSPASGRQQPRYISPEVPDSAEETEHTDLPSWTPLRTSSGQESEPDSDQVDELDHLGHVPPVKSTGASSIEAKGTRKIAFSRAQTSRRSSDGFNAIGSPTPHGRAHKASSGSGVRPKSRGPKSIFLGVIITELPPGKRVRKDATKPNINVRRTENLVASKSGADAVRVNTNTNTNGRTHQAGGATPLLDALTSAFSGNAQRGTPPPPIAKLRPLDGVQSRVVGPPRHVKNGARGRLSRAKAFTAPYFPLSSRSRAVVTQEDIDSWQEVKVGRMGFTSTDWESQIGHQEREEVARMNLRFIGGWRADEAVFGGPTTGAARLPRSDAMDVDVDVLDRKRTTRGAVALEKSRMDMYVDLLDDVFGPGDIYRGSGPKPKNTPPKHGKKRPAYHASTPSESQDSSSGDVAISPDPVDNDGSNQTAPSGVRSRASADLGSKEHSASIGSISMTHEQDFKVDDETAQDWAMALQKLIKGKMQLDRPALRELRNILDNVDKAKDIVELEVLQTSRLAESVLQISKLGRGDIPFGDEENLRGKAKKIVKFWSSP